MEWKQLRLRADIHEKLKTKADAEKISMGELIERLLGGDLEAAAPAQSLPGTEVDMSDWVDGAAPECCIDSIANDFKPGHVCPDWVRLGYTDKNGLSRQAWFNKKTGEYEFSERWKQIRADYRYE